jgi:hypothetical protein
LHVTTPVQYTAYSCRFPKQFACHNTCTIHSLQLQIPEAVYMSQHLYNTQPTLADSRSSLHVTTPVQYTAYSCRFPKQFACHNTCTIHRLQLQTNKYFSIHFHHIICLICFISLLTSSEPTRQ